MGEIWHVAPVSMMNRSEEEEGFGRDKEGEKEGEREAEKAVEKEGDNECYTRTSRIAQVVIPEVATHDL
jgi:hypothetical protein